MKKRKSRKPIIDYLWRKYETVVQINAESAYVYKNGLMGVYSIQNQRIAVPVNFPYIKRVTRDKFLVWRKGLWGLYSVSSRKLILKIEYDQITIKKDRITATRTYSLAQLK